MDDFKTLIERLLPVVKANLILTHNEDDELLRTYICAAIDYAKNYTKDDNLACLPASVEYAIVVLSTHFYESRDGSTGGFFADSTGANKATWDTVNMLLRLHRVIEV
jgi:hypothetical protein